MTGPAAAVTPPPVDPADNLISNGDFSKGTTDWLTCGGEFSVEVQGTNNG